MSTHRPLLFASYGAYFVAGVAAYGLGAQHASLRIGLLAAMLAGIQAALFRRASRQALVQAAARDRSKA